MESSTILVKEALSDLIRQCNSVLPEGISRTQDQEEALDCLKNYNKFIETDKFAMPAHLSSVRALSLRLNNNKLDYGDLKKLSESSQFYILFGEGTQAEQKTKGKVEIRMGVFINAIIRISAENRINKISDDSNLLNKTMLFYYRLLFLSTFFDPRSAGAYDKNLLMKITRLEKEVDAVRRYIDLIPKPSDDPAQQNMFGPEMFKHIIGGLKKSLSSRGIPTEAIGGMETVLEDLNPGELIKTLITDPNEMGDIMNNQGGDDPQNNVDRMVDTLVGKVYDKKDTFSAMSSLFVPTKK